MNQVQKGNSLGSARVSRVGCGVSPQRSCPFREASRQTVALGKVRDGADTVADTRDACSTQSSETKITAIGFILDEVHSDEGEIDQLDAGERRDQATDAVDEKIADKNLRRADRSILHPRQRERNQRDDDEGVENDGT